MVQAITQLAELVGTRSHLLVEADTIDAIVDGCTRVLRPHRLSPVGRADKVAAHLHHLPLGPMSLNRLRYGIDVDIEPQAPEENDFLVTLPVAGAARFRYGRTSADVAPACGALTGPYGAFRFEIGGDFDQIIVRLDRRRVETVCAGLLGSERRRPVHFDLTLTRPPEGWVGLLANAAALAQGHGLEKHPVLTAHLEELVIGSLLLNQPHSFSADLTDAARPALPQAVRRAVDYMRAHIAQPVRLHEVARHAGVSLRSLQTAFQNNLGTSPSAWLREERLEQVHATLSAAAPGSTTVTAVALDWGFIHLGEFAARYRTRFGAKPSHVLANRR